MWWRETKSLHCPCWELNPSCSAPSLVVTTDSYTSTWKTCTVINWKLSCEGSVLVRRSINIISPDFVSVFCFFGRQNLCLQGYIRCLYNGKLQVIMWGRCTWRGSTNIVISRRVLVLCTQAKWTLIRHLSLYLVSMPTHAKSEYNFTFYQEGELFMLLVTPFSSPHM